MAAMAGPVERMGEEMYALAGAVARGLPVDCMSE